MTKSSPLPTPSVHSCQACNPFIGQFIFIALFIDDDIELCKALALALLYFDRHNNRGPICRVAARISGSSLRRLKILLWGVPLLTSHSLRNASCSRLLLALLIFFDQLLGQ